MNKKAYFFSMDALISLIIILGLIFFIRPSPIAISKDMRLQDDLIQVFSSIKVGELNNSYAKQLISEGKITNLNQTLLEQIGEFYSTSQPEAEYLTNDVLSKLNLTQNIGLYFNNVLINSSEKIGLNDSKEIWVSRQIISGIQKGNSTKGYSSRAFLLSDNKVEYFYFGGYVGDGNISVKLKKDIVGAEIEGVFSGPFDLYINNNFVNSYNFPLDTPSSINLAGSLNLFFSGENYIDFRSNNPLYIAGGYVRVVYNSSLVYVSNTTKNFPGINGVINLYDGLFIPENLTSMEIFIRYNSNYNLFLNLGNKEIYSGNSSGNIINVTLNNSYISNILDYNSLSQKTIPLRLGLRNISYFSNQTFPLHTFAVTDISGSMAASCSGSSFYCCFFNGYCRTNSTCRTCGGIWEDKIGSAKSANNLFIDLVLNASQISRVGLVAYSTSASDSNYYPLSRDNSALKAEVNSWTATGSTCICCGINKAVSKLLNQSMNTTLRSIIVMSDGEANVLCSQQGTGNAKQDAIQSACTAYNNYNITVYAIGFGSTADEATLQSIASCGRGNYYFSDIDNLIQTYGQIATDLINASYSEQTVVGANISTRLYPDSYILLNHKKTIPYGLIISTETVNFNNLISQGSFNISNDTIPYEASVVSYSGSKWTNNLDVYNKTSRLWENVFNLSEYNLSYINLGDPYVVTIPTRKIIYGENIVRVSTGVGSVNSTGGSIYDKAVYSVVKNISGYSKIVSSALGCIWDVEFEDGTNSIIKVPKDYNGTDTCSFKSSSLFYNNNDAIANAMFNLLSSLDLNSNRKIETRFSENDLSINSLEVTGIPFTWESEVQVRVWD